MTYRWIAGYLKINTHEKEFFRQGSECLKSPECSPSSHYVVMAITVLKGKYRQVERGGESDGKRGDGDIGRKEGDRVIAREENGWMQQCLHRKHRVRGRGKADCDSYD